MSVPSTKADIEEMLNQGRHTFRVQISYNSFPDYFKWLKEKLPSYNGVSAYVKKQWNQDYKPDETFGLRFFPKDLQQEGSFQEYK